MATSVFWTIKIYNKILWNHVEHVMKKNYNTGIKR